MKLGLLLYTIVNPVVLGPPPVTTSLTSLLPQSPPPFRENTLPIPFSTPFAAVIYSDIVGKHPNLTIIKGDELIPGAQISAPPLTVMA